MAQIIADIRMVHHRAFSAFWNLSEKLDQTRFRVFETYRTPERQDALFKKGTTKALKFQSAHQFGLAIDCVPFIDGQWCWEANPHEWDTLHTLARECGLNVGPDWDPGHIEHPLWQMVQTALRT